jgi:hypothetical protein
VAQNRVTPYGTIEDLPGRGTLMGNRGILHDGTEPRIKRRWTSKAWIACALEFPPASRRTAQEGWRAPMWENRRWTALFFLDEATALAAGHRPCALCRRGDHRRFRDAWGDAPLKEIDAALHVERTGPRQHVDREELTDAAMVEVDGQPCLVWRDALRPWSMAGYGERREIPERVTLLTPPSLLGVLWRGYEAAVHESAR